MIILTETDTLLECLLEPEGVHDQPRIADEATSDARLRRETQTQNKNYAQWQQEAPECGRMV